MLNNRRKTRLNKFMCLFLSFTLFFSLIPWNYFVEAGELNEVEEIYQKEIFSEGNGKRELKDLRSKTSKTFLNQNGSLTTEISEIPMHYLEEEAVWKEIDNRLILDQNNHFYQNKQNEFRVKLNKSPKDNQKQQSLVRLEKDDLALSLNPVNKVKGNFPFENKKSPKVQDNVITYEDVYENVDIIYTIGNDRVKEDIVLHERPNVEEPLVFSFLLELDGMELSKSEDGLLLLVNQLTKEPEFYLESPFMYDSTIPEGYEANEGVKAITEASLSYDVEINVEETDEEIYLHVIPSHDWLLAEERIYPVMVDPTIVRYQGYGKMNDTVIRSQSPTVNGGAEETIAVGFHQNSNNRIRTLLKFDLSNIPKGSQVLDAQLNLWMASVSNDTPIHVNLHEVTNSWTEFGATWNTRNGSNSWSVQGGDFRQNPLFSRTISSLYDLSFNFRWNVPEQLISNWIHAPEENYGLLLKSASETTNTFKRFVSSDDSRWQNKSPLLVVTYFPASRLGLEDYWDYDVHAINGGQAYVNLMTGNNVIQYTDLFIPARGGLNLEFTRTYNSKSIENSALGFGWTFTGNESIYKNTRSNHLIYTDSDGSAHRFTYDSVTRTYLPPPGLYKSVKETTSGFTLTDKDGISMFFEKYDYLDETHPVIPSRIKLKRDRIGNTLTYHYEGNQLTSIHDPSDRSIHLLYKPNGKIEEITYGNKSIKYLYNSAGKLNEVRQQLDSNQVAVTTYQYHPEIDYLDTIIDPNGRKVNFTYHEEFIKKVQLPSENEEMKDLPDRPGFTYDYNIRDRIATKIDPMGNTTEFFGNQEYVVTQVDNHLIDQETGEIVSVLTTSYDLDENYNLKQIITPNGGMIEQKFDQQGNLEHIIDEEGHKTSYTYTGFNQVETIIDSIGNKTTYVYYDDGNLWKIIDPKENATVYEYYEDGTFKKIIFPNGTVEEYEFFNNNTRKTVTDSLNRTVTTYTDESGNVIKIVDAEDHETNFEYNKANLLTVVTDAKNYKTTYMYDDAGNRTKIVNANGHVTEYEYNGQHQISLIRDANDKEIKMNYDYNGNLIKRVNQKGEVIDYAYNELNQLKNIKKNNKSYWTYIYDKNGNLLKVANSNSENRNKEYSYFNNGLLEKVKYDNEEMLYEYLGNNFLSKISINSNNKFFVQEFVPTKDNRVLEIKRNDKIIASFVHNKIGVVENVKFGNGAETNKYFDNANRLKVWENILPNGQIMGQYEFDYDKNYNLISITSKDYKLEYEYDKLNQLEKETLSDGTIIKYNYDKVGNRVAKTSIKDNEHITIKYSYDKANQLTHVNGKELFYDLTGNLENDGDFRYYFDEFNQLVKVEDVTGNEFAVFTYDHEGRRTSLKTSSREVFYHYNGEKVIYETDDRENIIREYTWDENGNPLSMYYDGNLYYYLRNSRNDVVSMIDEEGNIVAMYEYDAWGNIINQGGELASINPYRYASYVYDEEIGMYYLTSRYYSPIKGRFITRDQFVGNDIKPTSQNLYVYVNNNPVMFVDPDGNVGVSAGIYFIPGFGQVALLATGVVVVGSALYIATSWVTKKINSYLLSKKQAEEAADKVPNSLKKRKMQVDLSKFKDKHGNTPETKSSGTFSNGNWIIQKDTAGHIGSNGANKAWKVCKGDCGPGRVASIDRSGNIIGK